MLLKRHKDKRNNKTTKKDLDITETKTDKKLSTKKTQAKKDDSK